MKTRIQTWLARVALSLVAIAAWGPGATAQSLSGTYGGDQCLYELTFRGTGVVYITTLGMSEVRGRYKVDGDKVSVTAPGWAGAVFTRKGNALQTPFMGETMVCTKLSGAGHARPQVAPTPTPPPTPSDRAAIAFIRAAIDSHWVKGPDGWTTQYQLRNMLDQPLEGLPEILYRQYREIKFTIQPQEVSEAQRLNGADYRGTVTFEKTASRVYRTVDAFGGRKGWSDWEDDTPLSMVMGGALSGHRLAVERRNGQWLIQNSDLFDGLKPDAATAPRTASATESPAASDAEWTILARMKSDLRNLVTAEEAYFADHAEYTAVIGPGGLDFVASQGNSTPRVTLTSDGWTATIRNVNTQQVCAIFVGSTAITPATKEGEPQCNP